MSKYPIENLIPHCTNSASTGTSKTLLERTYKKQLKLSDKEIKELFKLCNFKTRPKEIDYEDFYNNKITKLATKIDTDLVQLYTIKNFITKQDCDEIIEHINKTAIPSTVANKQDKQLITDYRTSSTAHIHVGKKDLIDILDAKLAYVLGMELTLGEVTQGQKYEIGEYYKEHYDFFCPTVKKEYNIYCEYMGQRTWTTMLYLNDVEEGGETYFKYLDLKLKPQRGTLLAWNNLYKDGEPNYKTMHEALPPKSNSKYILTKWWRSWNLID